MTSKQKDHLFFLIKSLDKAEKRNFKLYATRTGSKEVKFIQLFDLLDKQDSYNEQDLLNQIKGLTKSKLANLKRHLNNQILKSLRLIYSEKEIDIQIREQLDYARILYTKGFYLESLKILDKLKSLLKGSNRDILLLETVEFQKMIELRHITRSRQIENKMEKLIDESVEINRKVSNLSKLATLNINIQGIYIKTGHVRNDRDMFFIKNYFYSNLPEYQILKVSFFERVLVYQSFVWYHYMTLNFAYCYKNAKKWVDLFHSKPHMIEVDAGLYLRGLHYMLTCLFYLNHHQSFMTYYKHLLAFEEKYSHEFSVSTDLLYFIYGYNATLNHNLMFGKLRENLSLESAIQKKADRMPTSIDPHRVIIFRYKIGWSYFMLEQYDEALLRFDRILQNTFSKLRADTFCYTKLLVLLCHFEKEEFVLVQNQISNLRKYLATHNELNDANAAILSYINYCSKKHVLRDEKKLLELSKKLSQLLNDPYQKRAFIYFNYLDWVEAKIQQISMEEFIQNKL